MNSLKRQLLADFRQTKVSLMRGIEALQRGTKTTISVFSSPTNTLYGFFSSISTVLLAAWFANLLIIQSLLQSTSLSLTQKLDFMFSMFGPLARNIDTLQLVLIGIHLFLWFAVASFWLEAIKLQHERPRLKPAFASSILATIIIGGSAVLAISLITPTLTRDGLNTFVSDHFSGTLLLMLSLFGEFILIKKFVRLIARTQNIKL